MKIKNLLFALLVFTVLNAQSQTYSFSKSTGAYSDLAGSTSLNNGMTWDDPNFEIPVGFNFTYFNTTTSKLFITHYGYGGSLTTDTNYTNILPVLEPYGADIIDRGYNTVSNTVSTGSLSNISYKLEGTAGSRILKIEWKNAGFYDEFFDNDTSSDYTNFQLWLYEGSNDIEIHFGDNSVTQPNLSYGGETGSYVSLVKGYDFVNDSIYGEAMMLQGDPANPGTSFFTSFAQLSFLNGTIPSGTVYKFSQSSSGISSNKNVIDFAVYPNPCSDYLYVLFNEKNDLIEKISITNLSGQRIIETANAYPTIDISGISPGIYFVEVQTKEGIGRQRLIKN